MSLIKQYIRWRMRNAGKYWRCDLCGAESGTDGDVVAKAAEHTRFHETGGIERPRGAHTEARA